MKDKTMLSASSSASQARILSSVSFFQICNLSRSVFGIVVDYLVDRYTINTMVTWCSSWSKPKIYQCNLFAGLCREGNIQFIFHFHTSIAKCDMSWSNESQKACGVDKTSMMSNIAIACVRAWQNIGNTGVQSLFAFSIHGVDACVKSAQKWAIKSKISSAYGIESYLEKLIYPFSTSQKIRSQRALGRESEWNCGVVIHCLCVNTLHSSTQKIWVSCNQTTSRSSMTEGQ